MPYDMRIRTSAGWINMTDMVVFRKIHNQEWAFSVSSGIHNVTRQVDVSLRDHTDFNGKSFEILIRSNVDYIGTAPSDNNYNIFSNFNLSWNGGNRIVSTSTFRMIYNNTALTTGSYVVNMDAYIVET